MSEENRQRRIWEAVRFEPFELAHLAKFFHKHFSGHGGYGSMSLFQWKIIDNYVARGVVNLIKDGNKIVSTASITPKRLYFMKKEQVAAEIGDTYTDPQYQRQGMFLLAVNKSTADVLENGISFIYGTPNDQSLPGYEKKANYKVINEVEVKSLSFPVDIRTKVQSYTGVVIGKIIGSFFSAAIFCGIWIKKIFLRPQLDQVENVEVLPDDWDKFWMKSREAYDFIFCRDKQALQWRFFENHNNYHVLVHRENNDVVGYLVYRIVADPRNVQMFIADYLFLPGQEEKMTNLLFKVVQHAFVANVNFISTWCVKQHPAFSFFKKFGFMERNSVPIICYQNDHSLNMRSNAKRWHFTMSDSDNV